MTKKPPKTSSLLHPSLTHIYKQGWKRPKFAWTPWCNLPAEFSTNID